MKFKFNAPAFLVVSTTLLVYIIVWLLFFRDVSEAKAAVLFTILGQIIGKWASTVDYHFGSSSGSAAKDAAKDTLLGKMTGTGDGTGTTTTKAKITSETTIEGEIPPKKVEP